MKRLLSARKPKQLPPSRVSKTTEADEAEEEMQRRWHVDAPSGTPAPVIRANMISLRISQQGRVQVAFFDVP